MEKLLIVKIKRTDATRAELYGKGHKWPDMKLFDLGELLAVGIKPDDLAVGVEMPCRFWAHYELSEKLNEAGNPYKDVVALEPFEGNGNSDPAPDDATLAAILVELKAQTALLRILAQAVSGAGEEPGPMMAPPEPDEEDFDLAAYMEAKPSEPPVEHEPVPTSGPEMVGYLGRLFPAIACQGLGHLLYVMKKVRGEDWGWPNSEDKAGWGQVVQDWATYWEALT